MRKPSNALLVASSIALAVPITGCAMGGGPRSFAGKVDMGNVGLAMRAQAAIEKGDSASAIQLAEKAVENSPTDGGFRALLGNAYLAGGRFRSAEAAYADALALYPNQAGVPLKLALAQAAQGKADAATATLDSFSAMIDPADAGLALALGGRPGAAIELLDQAARSAGADGRVRQNLALAHALAGDWQRARSVAAQDLTGDQLEARMSEWATFARPSAAGSQVALMLGLKPAVADQGQPARLALKGKGTPVRMAVAEQPSVAVVAAPVAEPVAVAQADVSPAPSLSSPIAGPMPEVASVEPVAAPVAVAEASPDVADMVDSLRREPIRASGALPKVAQLRRSAAKRFGKSQAVVQLGAYATQAGVKAGWNNVAKRHASLRSYVPASARFAGPRGTVYRLSLKGFASDSEARNLCMELKAKGASCFVRTAAGDSPVRFASR
ncbi:hypothetical protein GCM10022280_17790 [Sphingomonas swuensis]|uniref:SPOR domain-containing protein n=1 Tax=Sphingomonas swuensis TaxID=977800 RepID=A0ABP7SZJ1_9SPHN